MCPSVGRNRRLKILQDELMSKHTSFKIGGPADFYIIAKTADDVKEAINFSKEKNMELTVIGSGTNILVRDGGIRGVVLKIEIDEVEIVGADSVYAQTGTHIVAGAGAPISKVAVFAMNNGLTGLEFSHGIPGTMGGAVKINAGCFGGEIKDVLVSSTYIDEKLEIKTINNQEHEFSYRHSIFSNNNNIIISSTLELQKGNKQEIQARMDEIRRLRKEQQPIQFPSAGSTFKRGDGFITAKAIDECGLKGYKIGGAMVSDLHAGFIINTGNATAKDVLSLVEYVKAKVKEKFGKEIKLEIIVLGED